MRSEREIAAKKMAHGSKWIKDCSMMGGALVSVRVGWGDGGGDQGNGYKYPKKNHYYCKMAVNEAMSGLLGQDFGMWIMHMQISILWVKKAKENLIGKSTDRTCRQMAAINSNWLRQMEVCTRQWQLNQNFLGWDTHKSTFLWEILDYLIHTN